MEKDNISVFSSNSSKRYNYKLQCLTCLCMLAFTFIGCISDDDAFMDNANFFDTKSYSKRYTEGFLDMIISRKGVISPSYHITSCQFTHQDLSTLVLPWRSGFSSEDTFSILNRDGETLGIYRINFTGNESTLSGFEADGWKLKKVTTTARVVVPYHVQAYYLKIGSKKIRIPDTTRKID